MLNRALLQTDVQQFITDHLHSDLSKVIFKGSPFNGISIQELATQIAAKKKAVTKLPTWFQTNNCYFPPLVNLEQSSSETTANYKSKLVSGDRLIDITGGLGVDCYAFSKRINKVIHCEINTELSTIVEHNYQQLQVKNIDCFAADGIDFLQKQTSLFDWIFIDPSRRTEANQKVFLLADCLPNVPKNIDFLFTKAASILIKNSPILDITNAINELKFVKEIHVVALQNDVKEVLFILEKDFDKKISIKTVNYHKNEIQTFNFTYNEQPSPSFDEPASFLYEPNAAILKSGGFNEITEQYKLKKLHPNSHLYTNDHQISFPGRVFKINHVIPYDKRELKKVLPQKKANITTRNFPDTVAQIRKKTGFKDGGDSYLFFTTNLNNKLIVIICSQIFQ